MSQSFSPINFDGPLRADANHAGNKQYNPNSFAYKFRPDLAEHPYRVHDAILSRKSHYWHEGKPSDYAQATELWSRVMTDVQREHTLRNTAKYLSLVQYPEVQEKYLAQLWNIAEDYARGVYDLLGKKEFAFERVVERAKGAPGWYKEEKFRPTGEKLVGVVPGVKVYNA
jgi:catalase